MKRLLGTTMFALAVIGIGCEGYSNPDQIKGVAPKPERLETVTGAQSTDAFSYTPPPGWQLISMPGSKYKSAMMPIQSSGFASTINILEENFGGSLAEFAAQRADQLRRAPNATILKEEQFSTTTGSECRRLVVETTANATRIRQSMYFFGKGDKKFIVSCTAQAERADKLDPVFEASMATFRVVGE